MQKIPEDGRKQERTEAQKASLAAAREKAQAVRKTNANLKRKEKEILQLEKQQKTAEIDKKLEKLRETKVEQVEEVVEEVEEEIKEEVVEEEEGEEEVVEVPKKTKKKKRIVVVEASSSEDEIEIELPKPKSRGVPAQPAPPRLARPVIDNPMLRNFF